MKERRYGCDLCDRSEGVSVHGGEDLPDGWVEITMWGSESPPALEEVHVCDGCMEGVCPDEDGLREALEAAYRLGQ